MPLTYVDIRLGGFQLSGWAWVVSFAVAAAAVATGPLHRRALGYLSPYLLFLGLGLISLVYTPVFLEGLLTLGQMSGPALVYLVAFRAPLSSRVRRRSLRLLAGAYAAAAVALLVAGFPQGEAPLVGYTGPVESVSVVTRPLSINLIILFLLTSALSRSRIAVAMAGIVGLVLVVGMGSRIAAAVLLLLVWLSPRVFISWRSRFAAVVIGASLLPLALSLPGLQGRFFFGQERGTLQDVFSLAPNVNTSGRRELWPKLISYCDDKALIGYGIGASYELSRTASQGWIAHPHNDYIRTFCDTGLTGSLAAWWFLGAAAIRSFTRGRERQRDWVTSSALLGAIACALLAVTDNVLVYAGQFTLPLFLLLAWADASRD